MIASDPFPEAPPGESGGRPERQLTFGFPAPGAEPFEGRHRWRWRGAAVMGILNVTPDSFSDGGRHGSFDAALDAAEAMAAAGAAIVDVGGESTRPGATPVPVAVELRRVLPVVEALAARGGVLVSVDTSKPEVARRALEAGAHLINDVTGLRDPAMRAVCAEAGAPAVVMHMRGEPRTMQRDPRYADVLVEVEAWLLDHARRALADGVPAVAIDPGIGFGKTLEHNLALLRGAARLAGHGLPLLVGASRKRFLGRLVGRPDGDPAGRDPASIAVHLDAAARGATLLRVHDVPGHVDALRVQAVLRDEDL